MAERGKKALLRELKHEARYADGEIKKAAKSGDATRIAFQQGYRNGLGFAIRTILDAEVGADG